MEGAPVSVPAGVLEGIEAVRRSDTVNMLDRTTVAAIAGAFGHIAARDWIEANPTVYADGIFRGFVAKSPWDAPISDFEDCRCGCGHREGCSDGG